MIEDSKPRFDDEIDLVALFQTLWDGKWNIAGAVFISLLCIVGYLFVQPPPDFEATTEIKPITSVDAEKFRQSNAVGFFEVSRSTLLNLYIEQLEERTLFEEAILRYELLDATEYEDDVSFNEAVIALAASIEILPPINVDGKEKGDVRRFWTIVLEYNDEDKWKQVLSSVDKLATQSVKSILQQRFELSLLVARQKRDFELEDIETQMANTKRDFEKEMAEFELRQGFQLEDIQTQIGNSLSDYERKTTDRLAFLREQGGNRTQVRCGKKYD